ncbi:Thaumatin-like protein 1 [Bienertia sinuspersici]
MFALHAGVSSAAKFTFINQCTYTIWPATLTSAGFPLLSGATNVLDIPTSWSGRTWARTHCTSDPTGRNFSCGTGDCGTGSVECIGSGAIPPASLAEFTLNGSDGLDFYDVSLVDGYNLPMTVRPVGGLGNCSSIGCTVDLNGSCPTELRVGMACKSACEAFGDPQYCCSGPNATPNTCKPSKYSEFFKAACPTAYSYAYDDATSTFTCHGADYVINFCPTVSAT